MILKEKDSVAINLERLEAMANLPGLAKDKLVKVEKEIKLLRSGNKGEQDSAYFIDFYFKNSKNWTVIHDLRLEYDGLVAQIDHLLINRFCNFYVLETKHYAQAVKVTERGEFLVLFRKHYIAVESPIEQNKRHVKVLKSLLKGESIMPKRLGLSLRANCLPYILVSPKSRVIRPKKTAFDTDMLIKADELYKQTQDNLENESLVSSVSSAANIISQDSLNAIGRRLVSYHQPAEIDYYAKFGIDSEQLNPTLEELQTNNLPCRSHPKPLFPRERDLGSDPLLLLGEGPGMRAQEIRPTGTSFKRTFSSQDGPRAVEGIAEKVLADEKLARNDKSQQSSSSKSLAPEPSVSKSAVSEPDIADSVQTNYSAPEPSSSKYFCCSCRSSISKKVALFCFSRKSRFKGKAYCFSCQRRSS
ncbi:MAG: nuclease-related domain-containing protein [Cyanobacteria bacterium J06627_32]